MTPLSLRVRKAERGHAVLCFGFVVASPGGQPQIEFAAAAPLRQLEQAAFRVQSAWTAGGQQARAQLKIVDVPEPVTAQGFAAAWRSGGSMGSDMATFLNLARQVYGPDQAGGTTDTALTGEAPAPVVLPGDVDELLTPRGERYFPPVLSGHAAPKVLRTLRGAQKHAALKGPPGSGKTTMAQVTFTDLIVATCDGSTSDEDWIGRWLPVPDKPGEFAWWDGPLLTAMREGRVILFDELPRTPHSTQAVLLPVMDHRRSLTVKGNNALGTVTAADGFAVLIAYNPESEFGLIPALVDRVAFTVSVPTALETARNLRVPSPFVAVAQDLLDQQATAEATGGLVPWAPGLRVLLDARDNTLLFGATFAAHAMVSASPDDPAQRKNLASKLKLALGDMVSEHGLTARPQP